MSSDSDGGSSSDEDFGQKLPPLSVAIKGILKRYPDGQIFKVLKLGSYSTALNAATGILL